MTPNLRRQPWTSAILASLINGPAGGMRGRLTLAGL